MFGLGGLGGSGCRVGSSGRYRVCLLRVWPLLVWAAWALELASPAWMQQGLQHLRSHNSDKPGEFQGL